MPMPYEIRPCVHGIRELPTVFCTQSGRMLREASEEDLAVVNYVHELEDCITSLQDGLPVAIAAGDTTDMPIPVVEELQIEPPTTELPAIIEEQPKPKPKRKR